MSPYRTTLVGCHVLVKLSGGFEESGTVIDVLSNYLVLSRAGQEVIVFSDHICSLRVGEPSPAPMRTPLQEARSE